MDRRTPLRSPVVLWWRPREPGRPGAPLRRSCPDRGPLLDLAPGLRRTAHRGRVHADLRGPRRVADPERRPRPEPPSVRDGTGLPRAQPRDGYSGALPAVSRDCHVLRLLPCRSTALWIPGALQSEVPGRRPPGFPDRSGLPLRDLLGAVRLLPPDPPAGARAA